MKDFFEGYEGVRLWEDQLVDDVMLSLLLFFLISFALLFRSNYGFFIKMVKDMVYSKERQSIFEKSVGSDEIFRGFMIFQAIFLCSILFFIQIEITCGFPFPITVSSIIISICSIFAILYPFYLLGFVVNRFIIYVFFDSAKYKLWKNGVNATIGLWGIFLYAPIIWITFINKQFAVSAILFAVPYILCRFIVIYKTMRIFCSQKTDFIYISLYLCAQEILPLVFLYEGMLFLYNFIKTSTLWH
jgi:hypothetical protein